MKKKLLTILLSLLLFDATFAQIDNTMYLMERVPQSSFINPSQFPNCKFYIGGLIIPLFGQLPPSMTVAVNLPVDYSDVIFHGEGAYKDSLITPLHPTANIDDFLKKLRKVNYTSLDLQMDLLNFGFKLGKKSFLSFDLSERMISDVGMPKSLFEFAAKGNDAVRNADFTGLGVNVTYFHQLSLGFASQVTKTFAAGFRAKLLVGVANLATTSSKIELNTQERTNYINIKSEYTINTNLPLEVTLNDDGYVDEMNFTDFSEESVGTIVKDYALMTGNYGAAFDFGFTKDITSSLAAFASVEDLGMIRWKTNASQFALYDEDSMRFEGVNIYNLQFNDFAETIDLDSIVANFKEINYKEGAYTTKLPTKIYAGVRYRATKRLSLGLLGKFEILPNKVRSSATVTANFKPFKFTAATLSYSFINGNYNNIGVGFTVHPGPFQWYFVSDNLIGALLFPAGARSVSMRMGCNIVLGCVQKNGSRDDKSNRGASLLDDKKNKNKGVVPYSK